MPLSKGTRPPRERGKTKDSKEDHSIPFEWLLGTTAYEKPVVPEAVPPPTLPPSRHILATPIGQMQTTLEMPHLSLETKPIRRHVDSFTLDDFSLTTASTTPTTSTISTTCTMPTITFVPES